MSPHVNWPLVLLLSILGAGGVLGALALDDWSREGWSSVLIEAGAALALLSALVLLEEQSAASSSGQVRTYLSTVPGLTDVS